MIRKIRKSTGIEKDCLVSSLWSGSWTLSESGRPGEFSSSNWSQSEAFPSYNTERHLSESSTSWRYDRHESWNEAWLWSTNA